MPGVGKPLDSYGPDGVSAAASKDDDDDFGDDLFGSSDSEEDEETKKRLAAYAAKKAKSEELLHLTLLHSEWPKLHRVLTILSAKGLIQRSRLRQVLY